MTSVWANYQLAFLAPAPPITALEIQARAIIVVVKATRPRIRHQAVGAGAIKRGFVEQKLQLATMNRILRPIVTSPNTPRFGPDLQPFARVKTVILGVHTDLRQRRPLFRPRIGQPTSYRCPPPVGQQTPGAATRQFGSIDCKGERITPQERRFLATSPLVD